MSRRRSEVELAEIIRRAQEEPGIADLVALMKESDELGALERERREAAVVTTVAPAIGTASLLTHDS